jgi:hypothetical protein
MFSLDQRTGQNRTGQDRTGQNRTGQTGRPSSAVHKMYETYEGAEKTRRKLTRVATNLKP